MQPSEGPQLGHATARTFAPPPAGQSAPRPRLGHFNLEQYRLLLGGMLAQGHGIEALCLFLTLTRDALFELLVEVGLPTPHDRPLRRSGGVRAWKDVDFPILLKGWLDNWSAACIGHHLGRSRGSIWYKARRLGLPTRERRLLHWSERAAAAPLVAPSPATAPLLAPNVEPKRKRLPPRWLVKGTDKVLELTSKRNGLEVDWAANIDAYTEIGWRIWSGQRISRIAEDYGVSYGTITSQNWWLQAKSPKSHRDLVDDFDRARGEANAKALGGELRKCEINSVFPYWKVGKTFKSRRDKRNGKGRGLDF
jgi:hypothetical protein